MQINSILWLYALRLGQVSGGFAILFAPIMLLDPEYVSYALLMIVLGGLFLILPYSDMFKKVMDGGRAESISFQSHQESFDSVTGLEGGQKLTGENRQKKRARQRQEHKTPNGFTLKK